jgi:hypothetical protein
MHPSWVRPGRKRVLPESGMPSPASAGRNSLHFSDFHPIILFYHNCLNLKDLDRNILIIHFKFNQLFHSMEHYLNLLLINSVLLNLFLISFKGPNFFQALIFIILTLFFFL